MIARGVATTFGASVALLRAFFAVRLRGRFWSFSRNSAREIIAVAFVLVRKIVSVRFLVGVSLLAEAACFGAIASRLGVGWVHL